MRLIQILGGLGQEQLEHLVDRFIGAGEAQSDAAVCLNLESTLRSAKRLRETIFDLQPPSFRILARLLDAVDYSLPVAGLREAVTDDTERLAEAVTAGDAVGAGDAVALYRRVFHEARRNDLSIDPSESAILGVLRRELGIQQVDHFVLEHHESFWAFWRNGHAFLEAMRVLQEQGVVFVVGGSVVLPEDCVAYVRQVTGIEAGAPGCRRLYTRLRNEELAGILEAAGRKVSGSKEERVQRLVDSYIQPTFALSTLNLSALRELVRDLGIGVQGNKDDLVDRIAAHIGRNADLQPAVEPEPPAPPEPRELAPQNFLDLLGALRASDLGDILVGIGSKRVTGAKEHLLRLLVDSRFSERSLLLQLDSKQLEAALVRLRLRPQGTKADRAARLIEHFASGAGQEAGERSSEELRTSTGGTACPRTARPSARADGAGCRRANTSVSGYVDGGLVLAGQPSTQRSSRQGSVDDHLDP